MTTQLIAAIVTITLALFFYTVGVFPSAGLTACRSAT